MVHLTNGLINNSIPVQVICLQNKGQLSCEIKNSVRVVKSLKSHNSKDVKAVWALRKIFMEFRPSVINIHDYASLPYAVLSKQVFHHIPLMFTAHGLLYEGFENLQKRYRLFSRFLSGFTAVSESVAKRHQSYLNWKKNIQVIPNGVPIVKKDDLVKSQVRNELGIRNHDVLFLSVGNPRPEKGFEDLIQAALKLKSIITGPVKFKIAVAGQILNNEYCRMLLKAVKSGDLNDCFVFLGFRNNTAALYNAADIFVLPSRSEGLPMVILEAMTARLPVIATRVGGIPSAVGQSALLVNPQEPETLADAMHELMIDLNKRKIFARQGQELVQKKYSMEKMVTAYLQAYKDLVHTK